MFLKKWPNSKLQGYTTKPPDWADHLQTPRYLTHHPLAKHGHWTWSKMPATWTQGNQWLIGPDHKAGYFWGGYVRGGRLTSHKFSNEFFHKMLQQNISRFFQMEMFNSCQRKKKHPEHFELAKTFDKSCS